MKRENLVFLSIVTLLGLLVIPLRAATLGEALNAPTLTWTSGGSAAWFAQSAVTRDGVSAAECGTVPEWGESWIQTTVQGPGQLSFWWKVSRPWSDTITLVVNGTTRRTLTGRTDWTQESLKLSAGPNVIRWVVNGSFFDTLAKGWLDQVYASVFTANSALINNRYYPLAIGTTRTYRGFGVVSGYSARGVVVGVETVDGIRCTKTVGYAPDGTLYTWYAQDSNGGVWQLRNYDVAEREYDNDDYLIMPPAPKAGEPYTLWMLDYVVVSTSAQVTTPAGTFSGCLHLRSVDSAWVGLEEYYAPGVGEVKLVDGSGGYQLVSATGLKPPTFRLSGSVSAGTAGGSPAAGVTLRLTAPGALPRAVKSDASGRFVFTGLGAKTYTVTPSAYGMVFTPSQQSVALSADTELPGFVAHDLTSPLTVITNGSGRVLRSDAKPRLLIGRGYTVTAIPTSGYLFSNWVTEAGQVLTNGPRLRFTMESNMVLQANFVANPFIPRKGAYVGLFQSTEENSVSPTNAGALTLALTGQGTFSGSVRLAGKAHAFSGVFNLARQASVTIRRLGNTPLSLNLVFDDAQGITGQVSTAGWTANALAVRRATATSNPFAGRYSMLVMGQHDATDVPPGDGAQAVTVRAAGAVSVFGTMPDGSPVTLATGHSDTGSWPLYASLYRGRGVLLGWLTCGTDPASQEALWVKAPDAAARHYPAGFHVTRAVALQRYLPPALKQTATTWTLGRLLIGGGNLPTPLEAEVLVTNHLIKPLNGTISNLSLVITNGNGLFAGRFLHPVTRKVTPLRGGLVQGLPWVPPAERVTVGGGWFLGTNEGGYLWLEPTP